MSAFDRLPEIEKTPKKKEFKEPKQEESKPEIVPVPARESVPKTPEKVVNVLRSEVDAHIVDRMLSQSKSLDEVENQIVVEREGAVNRLSLPEQIEPYTKRFAFCWIYKDRKGRGIDEACTLYHWVLCNKTHFPEIAEKFPHIFSANGAIERGDNILAFRSRKIDEEMRKAPGIESAQRIKNFIGSKSGGDPAFYAPQSDEFEVDEKTGQRKKVSIVGL